MRRAVVRFGTVLAVAGMLGAVGSLITTTSEAYAFNCPSGGSTSSQKDVFKTPASGYDLHGWLGYCQQNVVYFQFYGGEDSRWAWGGSWHNVSSMSIHLRVWVCGHLNYDQTQTYSNSAYDQLVAPQYVYPGCLPQGDVSGYESVANSWSWSWYLNY